MAAPAPIFPPNQLLNTLVAHLNALPLAGPSFAQFLDRLLSQLGAPGRLFTPAEEAQLGALLGVPADPAPGGSSAEEAVRVIVEGVTYLFETAAFHNLKTAAFGRELLELGVAQAQAVALGSAWTAASAAAVNRLRARPLGAPLVLQASSCRVSLGLGSSAAAAARDASVALDLALGRAAGGAPEEVLTVELGREELAGLLERLDAVVSQTDSLS